MLICFFFFDSQEIVHKESVPPGQTVNQTLYGNSLKDSGKGWHVCDQASHTLGCCTTTTPHVTWQFPSTNVWQKKHSSGSSAPYSPDLSPRDFFLLPRLKNHLKWRNFGTLDNIQKSVTDELKGLSAEAFEHCYEQWKQRLRRCVAAQGNYFKGITLICKNNKIHG